jgi:hypothetical protein
MPPRPQITSVSKNPEIETAAIKKTNFFFIIAPEYFCVD